MNTPISIGLIGCGNIGSVHAGAIDSSDIGRLAAVYDIVPERAQALNARFGARVCDSESDLLETPGLGAVLIATPTALHAQTAIRAAEAGKAIFLEKPMALTHADCARVVDAARRHGVSLMIGQVLRYFEPFRSILEWSRAGWLGKLLHAHIWRMEKEFLQIADWKGSHAMAGGFLYEVSCHEFDFLRLLLGEPTGIEASLYKKPGSVHEIEDAVGVNLQFDSGAIAQYIGGTGFPRTEYGFCLRFEKVTLESNDGFDAQAMTAKQTPGSDFTMPALGAEDPYYAEVRAWLKCLSENQPMPVTGEDAAKTVALIEDIYRLAVEGRARA